MRKWLSIPRSGTAMTLLAAMLALVPWPFFLIAVLSIDPVILATATAIAMLPMVVIVLPQAAFAVYVFDGVARQLGKWIDESRRPRAHLAVALAALFALSWLPMYGGGENIAGGMRLRNLYRHLMIASGFGALDELLAQHPELGRERALPPDATLESLGHPTVVLPAGAPVPIAPVECGPGRAEPACLTRAPASPAPR